MVASSISRRIQFSINAFCNEEYENALIQFFPALDKTAKKRRPRDGVGKRIKLFISDQEAIITAIATENIFKDMTVNGVTFPDAIYKFGRTSIVHEGELDDRLKIDGTGGMSIGHVWNLPPSFILGLIVGVMIAPENRGEHTDQNLNFRLFGTHVKINDLWGAEDEVKDLICEAFRNPNLFN